MSLDVRSLAVNTAVTIFFIVSVISALSGLSPLTCCKRALAGAFLAYLAANLAGKAIIAILNSATNEQTGENAKRDNATI